MRRARWAAILVLALAAGAGPARADWTCEASVDLTSVPQGGEVTLTVLAQGDMGWAAEFELPEIPGVRIYSGGTNQSMSMVNGRTEASVSRTYFLRVETADDFTVGAVTVRAKGGACTTDPIAIAVTAPAAGSQPPTADTGNRQAAQPAPSGAGGEPGDDIFVNLEADQTEAWVGQQVVLTFSYWRRVQPWNNPSYTPPRTEGFWREDLGETNTRRVLRGRAYNVVEIRYAIFPTRTGRLTIEPAELQFPAGVFDRFFQTRRSRTGPQVLRTDPVVIDVKALPDPAPGAFSGLVASSLDLVSTVDRDTVPRGEAIGLKVRLTADGFLKGFSDLPVPAPAGTRLHDAGESYRTEIGAQGLVGRIEVEKVVVPDEEGLLRIPPVELSWFDTAAGLYRTARTGAHEVVVTPSDRPLPGDDESGFLRSEVARLGEDLAFIHPAPRSLSRRGGPWVGGALWWTLLAVPVVLLGGFRLLLARWDAERRDPAGRRRRRALAAARERLAAPDVGPDDVSRAVCGYVADRLDRTPASIGPDEVRAHCRDLGADALGGRLAKILAACDAARFGGDERAAGRDLAAEAAGILDQLETRSGGRRRRTGGAAVLLLVALAGLGTGQVQAAEPDRPGADPVRLLAEGNQAYTEGRLDDAVSAYLEARDLGADDAVLHFNLGNAYAREGELGRAVASYLRAQRLAPRDRDIAANLAWVRRHIQDLELDENPLPLFIAQLAGVVDAFTLDQWGVVLVALLWLVAGLVAWGWYREEFAAGLRRTLIGAAGALLLVIAVTAGRWHEERVRDVAVVVAPEVAVRSGPAENFSTLFEVHDGLTLNIVGRRADWVRIGMGGDWEGWVPAGAVEAVRLAPPPQGR